MTAKIKNGFFGPMKGLDSAKHGLEELPGGCLRAWIEHDVMPGVTPEMLRWWFEHINTWTTFNGKDFNGLEVPVYRFWHPFDHIAVSWAKQVTGPDGRLGLGSIIAIQENIGARHEVRARALVTKFDEEAFNFDLLLGGIRVGSLDHDSARVDGGSSFFTDLKVGVRWPLIGRLMTRLIRKFGFNDPMIKDWILHNIEESGETEKFVPQLYAQANGG